MSAVVFNGPTNSGLAPGYSLHLPLKYPGSLALTSIVSVGPRPNFGDPQIASSSLVWSGPRTSSPVLKTIVLQNEDRPSRRYFLHSLFALVTSVEVE